MIHFKADMSPNVYHMAALEVKERVLLLQSGRVEYHLSLSLYNLPALYTFNAEHANVKIRI